MIDVAKNPSKENKKYKYTRKQINIKFTPREFGVLTEALDYIQNHHADNFEICQ